MPTAQITMVSADRKLTDSKRFHHITGQLFADQYYHIYNARLLRARESLIKTSRFRWGDEVKNVPLEQLNGSLGTTNVFVFGTLFKLMPQQPSILKELEENKSLGGCVDANVNYTSDMDSLILHETDENVQVVGDIDVHSHVTGIPVSLLGYQVDGGARFHVNDVCYAGLNLSVFKPERLPQANQYNELQNQRLLILSGLEFGFDSILNKEKSSHIIEALKKLKDYVNGEVSEGAKNGFRDTKIVKIIVAGNAVSPGYTRAKTELIGASQSRDNRTLNEVFRLFDKFLYSLAQSGVEIDIMPGKNDPTSYLLPQQPFHPKILPLCGVLENVRPITNPCLVDYKNYTILGTSGENIEAIRQYSRIPYSTTIIKNTLEWGHIAPSAPDNLSCVPFKGKDPFIIDFVPDIYFAGNQPEFAVTTYSTETKSKIQIVSVPSFVRTMSCVSIDLSNLETDLINFG